MDCRQKLLLGLMVWGLVLFYETAVAAARTSQEIAKIALGSTVHVAIIDDAQGNLHGTGSGFFVGFNQIATNYHVIEDLLIGEGKLVGGAKLVGKAEIYVIEDVVVYNKERDIAVVKVIEVKGTGINVSALPLGDSDAVQIGETIYVAGNPKGLEGTFSDGIISGIRGDSDDRVFQMTAPISPGSSGGPVLNENGEVIGISVGGFEDGQNLNFAVPVNYLKQLANIPITPPPVKPKPVKPKVDSPRVEPKPTKPQVDPTPAEPKQVKPKVPPPSAEPKLVLTPPEIAKIAKGSTVLLTIKDAKGSSLGTGSGFVVHDGQIVTNYHVIEAIINEGAIGNAKLVGKKEIYAVEREDIVKPNEENDLAVVKVMGIDAPALSLGNSDAVEIGETIYVVGNPTGGFEGTVTKGIISAIETEDILLGEKQKPLRGKKFQTDASMAPGSSGGPVLNDRGEVIAISVAGTFYGLLDFNLAIAVNHLKPLVNKVTPPPAQSKPTKPQVTPTPTEPKRVKPEVTPPPIESKPTNPQAGSPKPEPPKPGPRPVMLDKGIKLYEQAKYSEAIEALNSAIQEIENPIHQAEAYLYLGGSKRGLGASNDTVKEEFRKAIRRHPNQKLPRRVGEDHPIFAELLEEVRKELTGELTVISLVPQTEIWIEGNSIDRKMLGTGRVSSRLLRGSYAVEGIYADGSQRKTVTIELDRHEILYIPPIVEHKPPSSISVGEIIPLTFSLISTKTPQQVKVYYKIYDKDGNELAQNSQKMRLWEKQSASSTWIYKVGLPSQKRVGLIEYYIALDYDNHLAFRYPRAQSRYYQIPILDNKQPTISVLSPRNGERFTIGDQTTVRAEVIDNSVVEEVRIYFLAPIDQSQKLSVEGSSDMYAIDITSQWSRNHRVLSDCNR